MSSPRPAVSWRRLHLPAGMSPAQAAQVLQAIATMHSAPRVVLETVGNGHSVAWFIGASRAALSRFNSLLATHMPEARLLGEMSRLSRVIQAVQLRIEGHRQRQLSVSATESATRAVLGALAAAGEREEIRLQVVLGQRLRPHVPPHPTKPSPGSTERRRTEAVKTGEHGFGCVVRVGVRSGSPERARHLVGQVLAAWRTLETPGVAMRLRGTSPQSFDQSASPWRWPLSLSVSELVGLLGWPVGDLPLPGVAARHPRLLPVPHAVPRAGRVLGDASAPGQPRPVAIGAHDSLRHLHVLGPTGTGKSTLLANLAISDMAAGRGCVVIDPKGDLVRDLLARVPRARLSDVVVLDATDSQPVGLNPLRSVTPDLAADGLVSLFAQLYVDNWGPRTQDIWHASLLSLARRGDASLVMVPLLLTNAGFRRSVVGRVVKTDPLGLGSFWAWFDGISEAERHSAIAPLMNKLRPLLLRPGLRAVLGQRQPRFEVDEVFTKRRILLVSLAKGELGSDGARLLGSLVVSLLWQAALRRSTVSADRRRPVMIVVDEVQDYLRLPGDLGDALAQARGLGVGFTLAHQHLSQLPPTIRAAVLANARSRVSFQLGHEDAVVMARGTELEPDDFTALPAFQAYASVLAEGSPMAYGSLATRPLPPVSSDAADIRAGSRTRYGRPLSDIEADLAELAGGANTAAESLGRQPRGDAS